MIRLTVKRMTYKKEVKMPGYTLKDLPVDVHTAIRVLPDFITIPGVKGRCSQQDVIIFAIEFLVRTMESKRTFSLELPKKDKKLIRVLTDLLGQ